MAQNPAEPVYRLYASLVQSYPLDSRSGLGGKLLYAGEIDTDGRNLLYAANIAGAASFAASADTAALRGAMRDGVVDFLVNSLEEALRILKNEIRKHQTVSVAVALDPERLVEQMLDRGVLPDLLHTSNQHGISAIEDELMQKFVAQGAQCVAAHQFAHEIFASWAVDQEAARWLPRLDALAESVLPPEDALRLRWLRLAPRYLGRAAQRQHGVAFSAPEYARFRALLLEWERSELALSEADAGAVCAPQVAVTEAPLKSRIRIDMPGPLE